MIEKIKKFTKKHKTEIFVITTVLVNAVACVAFLKKMSVKEQHAFIDGAACGIDTTIQWFDETFDDLALRDRWNQYLVDHPEKVKNLYDLKK